MVRQARYDYDFLRQQYEERRGGREVSDHIIEIDEEGNVAACPNCGSTEFDHDCVDNLIAERDRLQDEVAFWTGEGQQDRPEIIEYRKIASIASDDRTPQQAKRIKQLGRRFIDEDSEAHELRVELSTLREERDRRREEVIELGTRWKEAAAMCDQLKQEAESAERKLGKMTQRLNIALKALETWREGR